MKKLSLQIKIIVLLVCTGVLPLLIYGVGYTYVYRGVLIDYEFQKLTAVNEVKKKSLTDLFKGLESQLSVISENNATIVEFEEMLNFRNSQKEEDGRFDVNSSEYVSSWKLSKSRLTGFVKEFGYYDLFLITSGDGQVIYSDAREGDLGAVLSTGPLRDSGLGRVWQAADSMDKFAISDMAPYAPSNGEPAAFMARPLMVRGKKVGIIAIQIPTKLINEITQIRAGLGESSESYLVGPDHFMRSDSYLDSSNYSSLESFKKGNKVQTDGVKRAIGGETGIDVILDYRGTPVLSSFAPFKLPGSNITWALITEIDEDEALSVSNYFRNLTILGILVFGLVSLVVGVIVGRLITGPIMKYSNMLSDSINRVYSESNNVSNSSVSISQALTEQAASLEESSASLEEITGMVRATTDNATDARSMAEGMKNISKDGLDISGQLTNSMDEILLSNSDIEKLVDVISEIGEKTSVIDEIVFQTKLLSFNASVEAERAGEHGRGFAVVAQEVGNLAQLSGRAASEISEIVSSSVKNAKSISAANKDKVVSGGDLVKNASKLFESIDSNSIDILNKTDDISKAAREQADGIDQINVAISQLDKVTQSNVSDVEQATGASMTLDDQVKQLSSVIDQLNGFILGGTEVVEKSSSYVAPIKKEQSVARKIETHTIEETRPPENDGDWESL